LEREQLLINKTQVVRTFVSPEFKSPPQVAVALIKKKNNSITKLRYLTPQVICIF